MNLDGAVVVSTNYLEEAGLMAQICIRFLMVGKQMFLSASNHPILGMFAQKQALFVSVRYTPPKM